MNAPVRLTKENIDDIKGSRVCLLSYDEGYVRQMIDEFGDGFADRIDTFVDYSGKGIERSVAGRVIKRLEPGEEVCLPEDTALRIWGTAGYICKAGRKQRQAHACRGDRGYD